MLNTYFSKSAGAASGASTANRSGTPDIGGDSDDDIENAYASKNSSMDTAPDSKVNVASVSKLCKFVTINQVGSTSLGAVAPDKLASIEDRSFVSFDWEDEPTLLKYYDPKSDDKVSKHASVTSTSAAEAENAITLAECMNLFTQSEVLGKDNLWFVIG